MNVGCLRQGVVPNPDSHRFWPGRPRAAMVLFSFFVRRLAETRDFARTRGRVLRRAISFKDFERNLLETEDPFMSEPW
jgi:hypothetical protein